MDTFLGKINELKLISEELENLRRKFLCKKYRKMLKDLRLQKSPVPDYSKKMCKTLKRYFQIYLGIERKEKLKVLS